MQDAGENDRKGNDGDQDSGVLVEKSAARNARSRRGFFLRPLIKHLRNHGFLSRGWHLFSGYQAGWL
jgi:hypothetical protein